MSLEEKYNQLLEKYEALQLRVTRFGATEQELINIRDRLDNELVMYKRLHQFNVHALREQNENNFFQLVAETIIDIFEVEIGVLVIFDIKRNEIKFFQEGSSALANCDEHICGRALVALREYFPFAETTRIDTDLLNKASGLSAIDSGLVFHYLDQDKNTVVLLGGLITQRNAPLYHTIQDRNLAIFTVFAQKMVALYANRKKTQELRKINAELDNFVYSVSHDLRSPLMSIKGILSLVFTLEEIRPETANYLKLAEESVNRLDNTIQEILYYSRNARLDIVYEKVNVEELVKEILSDNRYVTDPPIQFHIDIDGDSTLQTDKTRLNTVLKNLIGNSVKYRNDRGEVPYVRFAMSESPKYYTLSVEDNGDGIPKKLQSKVFDMFYRGTRKSSGNGLGLYLCKEIVHKLNGTLSLSSEERKGTTMTIVLPKPQDEG